MMIFLMLHNATHQRAGAIDADFKTDPTAGSVACDGSWLQDIRSVTTSCCPTTDKRSETNVFEGRWPTHAEYQKLNRFELDISGGAGV